jgi:hypothetical protein
MSRRLLGVVILLVLTESLAEAQPGPPFVPSVDTLAINSQYIFIGRIIDIHKLSSANTNALVSVERWLKGDGQSDRIDARIDAPDSKLSEWKSKQNRVVIFSHVQGDTERVVDLSDPDLKVLTSSMEILRSPDQVLQTIQDALDRHPGVYAINTFRRTVPEQIGRELNSYTLPQTTVPADAELQRWALYNLGSSVVSERAEAADALKFFPSESNADRLKGLLNDPGVIENGPGQFLYIVHRNAYYSLLYMGYRVAEPILKKVAARE